jgi:hypothetical protein
VPGGLGDKHMKIKLLNDGGFDELAHVVFPIEVEGTDWEGCGFDVHESEFEKHGYDLTNKGGDDGLFYFSLIGEECEVVE